MPGTPGAGLPEHGRLRELPSPDGCQRWGRRGHSWVRRRDGGFDAGCYRVEPVSEATARAMVLAHHYSGSFPAATRRFGLLDVRTGAPVLVGVAVYSVPASVRVLTNVFPELEPYRESVELGRFCLLGPRVAEQDAGAPVTGLPPGVPAPPANAESWFLARTFERLAADGIRGVVSFSDPVPRRVDGQVVWPGHVGVIYQASGAVLTGRGTARRVTLLRDGTTLSDRSLQKVRGRERGHEYVERRLVAMGARAPSPGADPARWLADALDDAGAVRMRHGGNLRYAMATSRSDRRRLRIVGGPQAYPKQPDA